MIKGELDIVSTLSRKISIAALVTMSAAPLVGSLGALSPAQAANTTTVTGKTIYDWTNIRSGPSTSTSAVGHVGAGTTFTGTAANGWLHIASGPYSGKYVSLTVLQVGAPSGSTPTAGTVSRQTIYATTNVRSGPSTSSSIVGHLGSGADITGTLSNGWIKISSPSQYAGKYVSDSVLGAAAAQPKPPTPTQPTQPTPVYKINSPFTCTTNPALTSGTTNDCVKAVQNTLNSWMIRTNASGTSLMTVTGYYGDVTASNVKVFQQANGLPQSGSMTPDTWKALSSASQNTNTTSTASISGAPGDDHPAFPSAIKLTDGRLMIVFTSAKQHTNNTTPSTTWKTYSADGGYSWSTPEQIKLPNGMENTPGGLGIATSGPLAGRPILTTWSVDAGGTRHTMVVLANDLAGNTWGAPLDLQAVQGNSFTASPIVQVNDTDFQQAVYVYAGRSNTQAMSVGLTYDGNTFVVGTKAVIAQVQDAKDTNQAFSEVGMVKLRDGRLLALIRHDVKTSRADFYKAYSTDGGKTWGPASFAFYGSGAPRVTLLPDGRLVVLYRHMGGTSNTGVQQAGTMDAVYRVSSDDGATWGDENAEHIVGEHADYEMAYGTPIVNPDGTITFVYANESNTGASSHLVTTPNVPIAK